jgi:DNA-binding transcriptional LysR family regulator
MIELRLLRYFVTVAETEHVGRAAQRLHISQSPLSRQIRQLEDLLGVRLFARVGREIALTPDGKRLLEPARDLLARADAFVRDSRTDAPPKLAVGFLHTAITTGVLPAALRAMRARHPALEIVLRHATTEGQLAALRAGELDVALVHGNSQTKGLVAQRVLDQPYRLAVARSSPLAKATLTADVLGAAAWIAVRGSERARDRWLLACAAAGFQPRIALEVGDYTSATAMVGAGAGIALLPASQRSAASPEIVFRKLGWLRLRSELWAVHATHAAPLARELVALANRPKPRAD